jgi:NAD-dependent SIR2 family protein deacetylase
MGADGRCICPKCETETEHRAGIPCQEERCPKCGAKMLREGSEHYLRWKASRERRLQGSSS